MISNRVTLTISTLIDMEANMSTDDKEAFVTEWIKETYPEFFNVFVEDTEELDKE